MMSEPSPQAWFHDLGTKYVAAQVYFHLNQAGVVNYLAERAPRAAEDIARELALDPKVLSSLLDYVAAVDGVLQKNGEGCYGFTEFGRAVLKRYGREDGGKKRFNFLDVRVGAYGPVWGSLEGLLKGEKRYGREVSREGRFAEDGLYKSSGGFLPALSRVLERVKPKAAVEFGADTGLAARVAGLSEGLPLYALDRSAEAIKKASCLAREAGAESRVRWIVADVFEPVHWSAQVPERESLLFFSIHFHEFMAKGEAAVRELARALSERYPGSRLAVLEQPLLGPGEREKVTPDQWLYSQSNVLIHHLIGNGRILTGEEWTKLFSGAGCRAAAVEPAGYLGYVLFLFEL